MLGKGYQKLLLLQKAMCMMNAAREGESNTINFGQCTTACFPHLRMVRPKSSLSEVGRDLINTLQTLFEDRAKIWPWSRFTWPASWFRDIESIAMVFGSNRLRSRISSVQLGASGNNQHDFLEQSTSYRTGAHWRDTTPRHSPNCRWRRLLLGIHITCIIILSSP